MNPIQQTEYAYYLPVGTHIQALVLDSEESKALFELFFETDRKSYFLFSDDHWAVKSDYKKIGHWLLPYNANNDDEVSNLLKNAIDWDNDEKVFYLAKKSVIFQLTWGDFLKHWSTFLTIENDATFVIRSMTEKTVLMFTALGEIRHISVK